MKILHIITSLRIGGAEVALYNRLKMMWNDEGLQHLVICFYEGPILPMIRELGIEVIVIRGMVRGYDPVGFWQTYAIAQRFNPNIIHTALWAANIVGRALKLLLHVPVINELHGNVAHEGAIRNAVERWSCRGADRIVAVSQAVRVSYEQKIMPVLSCRGRQIVAAHLVTIVNGIDRQNLLKRVAINPLSRGDLGLLDDDFVIGAIGRLEKIKSYDVLIRSVAVLCKQLPLRQRVSIKIILVGDGSERASIERLVQDVGLEKQVMFMGYRTDAYRFYSIFDCFALSSQSEGLSIALLEAVALGIPVISTHLGLAHDAIVQGRNGILILPNDIEAYANGLRQLQEKQLVKACDMEPLLGNFAFSLETVVLAYRQMYQQLTY